MKLMIFTMKFQQKLRHLFNFKRYSNNLFILVIYSYLVGIVIQGVNLI